MIPAVPGTHKTELSAARLALVSDAPVAKRIQSENAALRAENERLQEENERLREENAHLFKIGEELSEIGEELKKDNEALTKENVSLCARLNRPASVMPRKGRLPPRAEEGARVVELDEDDEPEEQKKDEPEEEKPKPDPNRKLTPEEVREFVLGKDGQKLVKTTRRKA